MSLQIVFRYLVEALRDVRHVRDVRVLDQGAMVLTVDQPTFEEDIGIYLLGGELSTGFVKRMLNANTQRDIYTLFIVSFNLLSEDGKHAYMTDALRLLLQTYDGKVYAYQIVGQRVRILPVFIDADGAMRLGETVNLAAISGGYAEFNNKYLLGVRKIAGFEGQPMPAQPRRSTDPMQAFFDLLGVPASASLTEVKRAYRKKARQYHPDTNKSPDATALMQELNEAYTRILERLDG